MKEEIINDIFERNIDKIVYGFAVEDVDEVRNSYRNYLQRYVCNLEELMIKGQQKGLSQGEIIQKIKDTFNNVENNYKWEEKSVEEKSRLLIKDPVLQRIRELSDIAFKYAAAKKTLQENPNESIVIEPITNEELMTIQKEMEDLLNSVKEFNLFEARRLVSEGIIDIEYIMGEDKMSFRNIH